MKWLLFLLIISTSGQTFSYSEMKSSFLPPNHFKNYSQNKRVGGITEFQFNRVIGKLDKIYNPQFKALGKVLKMNGDWKNSEVNAITLSQGPLSTINLYGGLARQQYLTEDGFALVVCHEIGHHLGGAPKKLLKLSWSSTEGQSDYFASLKCLRELFYSDDNLGIVKTMKVPAVVKRSCNSVYKISNESALCQRISMAGKSVADFLSSLYHKKFSEFDTPSTKVVKETIINHIDTQCRLDTIFQGALCDQSFDGALSEDDPTVGTCNKERGDKWGSRPTCWYKAKN